MGICKGCGTILSEGNVYCSKCGLRVLTAKERARKNWDAGELTLPAPQPGFCAACGESNPPGTRFCQTCGVLLAPIANQPPTMPKRVTPRGSVAPSPCQENEEPSCYLKLGEQIIVIPKGRFEYILGRGDPTKTYTPDLDLGPYISNNAGVSRQHARITMRSGQYFLEDLNSTNLTFINNQKALPGQIYLLHSGDQLQLGQILLIYVNTA